MYVPKCYLLVPDKPTGVYRIKTNDKVIERDMRFGTQNRTTGKTVIKKIKSGDSTYVNAYVSQEDGGVYITNSVPGELLEKPKAVFAWI